MYSLQNFDADDFLANYWQKKPLLIRQALPGFESVLSPEELAGLACEEDVHSRLVIEKDAEKPWQLTYGPFNDEIFTSLPMTHYSVLVSECEKWIPELQELVDAFSFIPRWRKDDLMISYAPEHGSVGPHVDDYDVFLIQANGQRRWSIGDQKLDNPEIIPGLDMALLKHFEPNQEWILEPGDMLYLPTKIPHHGVAVGDGCMTYSMGFRGQKVDDLMDSFLLEASESGLTKTRYQDVYLNQKRNPGEITAEEILNFKSMIFDMLELSSPLWPDIVGKLISDSTLSDDVETVTCKNIKQAANYIWQKHPDSKFVYHRLEKQIRLYINGEVKQLEYTPTTLDFCKTLCNQYLISIDEYYQVLPTSAQKIFLELIHLKALIPVLDEE